MSVEIVVADDLLSFLESACPRAPRKEHFIVWRIKRNRRRGIAMKEIIFPERRERAERRERGWKRWKGSREARETGRESDEAAPRGRAEAEEDAWVKENGGWMRRRLLLPDGRTASRSGVPDIE